MCVEKMNPIRNAQKIIIYSTFGKASRMGEMMIGALLLGGASQVGSLPERATGCTGVFLIILCLFFICLLGIKTGRKTLSPALNSSLLAALIAIFHMIYISVALLLIYSLREPLRDVEMIIIRSPVQLLALISILTLSYLLTVLRTTSLSSKQREAKQFLRNLSDNIENDQVDVEEVRQNINNANEEIPESKYPDVSSMKKDLSALCDTLDRLDPDSVEEIISKDCVDKENQSDQYDKAVKIYNRVKEKTRQI